MGNSTHDIALRINVIQSGLDHIQGLVDELESAGVETDQFRKEAEQLRAALKTLGAEQGMIDVFKRLKTEVGDADRALAGAKARTAELAKELRVSEAAVASQRAALEQSRAATEAAGKAYGEAKARTAELAKEIRGTKEPTDEQKAAFERSRAATDAAGKAYDDAKARAAELAKELKASESSTKDQQRAFDQSRDSTKAAAQEYQNGRSALHQLREQMQQAGISTDNLANHQVRLNKSQADLATRQSELEASLRSTAGSTAEAGASAARLDQAYAQLGITSQSALSETAQSARDAYEAIHASGAPIEDQRRAWLAYASAAIQANNGVASATLKSESAARGLSEELKQVEKSSSALGDTFGTLAKAAAGLFAASKLKQYAASTIQVADAYGEMAERVSQATESSEEYDRVQERLLDTANRTYRPLTEAQEMYIRTASALRDIGYETEQSLDITDSFSYLLVTNAASAERASSAIDAYAKSIQTGRVDSQAWQSMLAATPTLVDAIAAATGRSTAEVRQLGITGKLALADLNEGLRQSVEQNRELADGMKTTFNDAIQRLSNTWSVFVGEANRAHGHTQRIVDLIDVLSDNLASVVDLAVVAGETMVAVWAVKALLSLQAYTAGLVRAQVETGKLAAATVGASRAAAGLAAAGKLAAAGWLGWEVGTYLRNEFAVVEKAGIALAAGLTKVAERAKFAWEVIQSPSDAEASYERLQQRLSAIDDEYAALFAAAGKAEEGGTRAAASVAKAQEPARDAVHRLNLEIARTQVALDEMVQAGADTSEIDAAMRRMISLSEQLTSALSRATEEQRAAVAAQASALRAAAENAEDAKKAVDDLLKRLLAADNVDLRMLTGAIAHLAGESSAAAEAIGNGLKRHLEQLSAVDLSLLIGEIEAIREQGALSAEQLRELDRLAGQSLSISFARLGIDADAALGRISAVARDAIADLDAIRTTIASTADSGAAKITALGGAIKSALERADTPAAVQAIIGRIEEMGKSGELAGRQLGDAMQAAQARLEDLTPGIQSSNEALRQLGITSDATLRRMAEQFAEAWRVIREDGTRTLREKEEAFRKYAEAVIRANNGVIDSTLHADAAASGMSRVLDDLVNKSGALSAVMQRLAGEMDEAAKAADRERAALDSSSAAAVKAAQNALAAAKAKGDENEIRRAALVLTQAEAAATQEKIGHLRSEIATIQQRIEQMELEALADGVLSDAEQDLIEKKKELLRLRQQELQQQQDKLQQQEQQEQVQDKEIQQAKALVNVTGQVRQRYADLSDAAAAYFDKKMAGVRTIREWWTVLSDREFERVRGQFEGLSETAQDFVDRLADGEATTYDLERAQQFLTSQTEQAKGAAVALGDEQLEPLRDAIRDAERRMQDLHDEAADTLTSLQDELLQLQGNEDALAQRRMERRRAELEAQLAEARASGDRDLIRQYEEALRVLEQIAKEEERQRQAEAKEREARDRDRRETERSTSRSGSGSGAGTGGTREGNVIPIRTVRMDLTLGGRQVQFDVLPGQENDVERLFRTLAADLARAN